ncbi:MAG TPA: zinc ABC transporter substrate-binding protein [Nitrospirae bacterium]|nr:zinc ABC transporter substrate-binding protein [Nitrospirota bacterium]
MSPPPPHSLTVLCKVSRPVKTRYLSCLNYYGIILSVITFNRLTAPAVLLLFFSVFACNRPVPRADAKLKVLTTIPPLYSFTKNITGDLANVENLLPSGAGPHERSLSPEDVKKVAEARILIINGVNLEAWLQKLTSSVEEIRESGHTGKEKLIVVDTSIGVGIINNDPHIWLSPKNAIIQVKNIRDALVKADPGNSELYVKNAAEYIRRLEDLDREIKDEIRTWKSKRFVAFHPAFKYFAKDYGLKQAAVIRETHEIGPSPGHIADVIETIKSNGIKAIFTEPQISHKIVKSIADDLDLEVYSLDTLETGSPYKEWYEDKMRSNLAVLKKALNRETE